MNNRSPSDLSPNAPEGHAALALFQLAPDPIHLNHGSYGAVPKIVREAQDRWRAHIESNPTEFFRNELPAELRRLAGVVAQRFGGKPGDWVFCENATAAVNSVLASSGLREGDEIVTTSHVYGAVLKAMRIWAERFGAKVVVVPIPAIVESEEQVVQAIARSFSDRTKLLIVDHITSATAIVFPVAQIVSAAHARDIAVLIDGAHVPGHLPLDVEAIGADWYTGNAHKWLFAPRGCGLLWTAPQHQTRTLPVVLSHGAPAGYTQAFDWIGTRDATAWLCLEEAVRFYDALGGESLMARNRKLAATAGELLAQRLGLQITAPAAMRGAMTCLTSRPSSMNGARASSAMRHLRECCSAVVPVYLFEDALCIRISAQIYNEVADYETLAKAFPIAMQQSLDS
ncbi:MAG: aminotransferase class V-fold PLP-dependent enzyme [Proteobacteria bacterium]|nr:aminotransferase class V-fold PLP-dependent enzyme [Pseudomonadota bacterium]